MAHLLKELKAGDAFTLLNGSLGVISLYSTFYGNYIQASLLIFLAVIADFLDGKVARMFGSSKYGKDLDSLCDIVSFGVAPAFLIYTFVEGGYFAGAISIVFVLAGILRLARFNTLPKVNYFVGMPITVNGIIIPLLLILSLRFFVFYYYLTILLPLLLLILAILMVSSLKVKKLGRG